MNVRFRAAALLPLLFCGLLACNISDTGEANHVANQTDPNQTDPNQTDPNQTDPNQGDLCGDEVGLPCGPCDDGAYECTNDGTLTCAGASPASACLPTGSLTLNITSRLATDDDDLSWHGLLFADEPAGCADLSDLVLPEDAEAVATVTVDGSTFLIEEIPAGEDWVLAIVALEEAQHARVHHGIGCLDVSVEEGGAEEADLTVVQRPFRVAPAYDLTFHVEDLADAENVFTSFHEAFNGLGSWGGFAVRCMADLVQCMWMGNDDIMMQGVDLVSYVSQGIFWDEAHPFFNEITEPLTSHTFYTHFYSLYPQEAWWVFMDAINDQAPEDSTATMSPLRDDLRHAFRNFSASWASEFSAHAPNLDADIHTHNLVFENDLLLGGELDFSIPDHSECIPSEGCSTGFSVAQNHVSETLEINALLTGGELTNLTGAVAIHREPLLREAWQGLADAYAEALYGDSTPDLLFSFLDCSELRSFALAAFSPSVSGPEDYDDMVYTLNAMETICEDLVAEGDHLVHALIQGRLSSLADGGDLEASFQFADTTESCPVQGASALTEPLGDTLPPVAGFGDGCDLSVDLGEGFTGAARFQATARRW